MSFATTWMDLEMTILSVVSQKETGKHHMIPLIYRIQTMTQINLSMKQKQIHRHSKQTCGCQGRGGGEEQIGNLGSEDTNCNIQNE